MTPDPTSLTTGRAGEDAAADYLRRRGWRIVERNWRSKTGELDIIARDPEGVLVVCEVKARRGRGFGDPLEAITWEKLRKLRSLTAEWVGLQRAPVGPVRLDAIGVISDADGWQLTHVRGIDS